MMEGSCNYSILLWLCVTCLSTKFNPKNGILLGKNGNWAGFLFFKAHCLPLPVIIPGTAHIQVCDKYDNLECYCNMPHVNYHMCPQRVRKLFCKSILDVLAKVAKRIY